MHESQIERLLSELHAYTVVDLSHTLEIGIPSYPTHSKYFQMRWTSMGDPAEMNMLVISEHTGTHVDSPSHFVSGSDDPARKHIDEIEPTLLIGRGIKLTFGPFDANNQLVTREDIVRFEGENDISIQADDIVLINFQWSTRWTLVPEGFSFLEGWPGISKDAVDYLVQKRVRAVGTDCISLDAGDGGRGELPAHYGFLPNGILIMENLANLGYIPDTVLFMALPLKIKNGTGSPLRALALIPKK